jgi:hypothetical protein
VSLPWEFMAEASLSTNLIPGDNITGTTFLAIYSIYFKRAERFLNVLPIKN